LLKNVMPIRSILIYYAMKPKSWVIRSYRWCTRFSKQAGESGGYVHWGATTQDIMDTAVVLQIRDAFALIESDMDKLRATLADLSRRYRDTPMAGRTHLQQALPVASVIKQPSGWICLNVTRNV
jgi:hypothetical protein